MVEMAAEAISIIDASMRLRFVNPAMAQMLGYEPEELIGASLASVTYESFPLRDISEQRWRRGEIERLEYCHRRKDGSPVWVALSVAPLFNRRGIVVGCIGVSRDITAERELRNALAASEAAYHEIFNHLDDVYFELDADGFVVRASPSALRHTGYTPDELVGMPVTHLLPDHAAFDELAAALAAHGTASDFETLFVRKDGEHNWVAISVSAVRDAAGVVTGYHGMLRDVTARRRAQADRDRLFALSIDMLAVLGPDGRYRRLNPAWTTATGYAIADLQGRAPIAFTHPDDRARAVLAYRQLARGEPVRDLRVRFRCANGEFRWHSINVAPAEGGEVFAVIRDITPLVEAEEEQRRVAGERERLRAEAEHAANHDPLTGLLNRRAWFAIAAERSFSALALFDIDYFKAINDRFGHVAGDHVLVVTAHRMQLALDGRGWLARVGGEEFGILFDAPIGVAAVLCEKVLDAVRGSPIVLPSGEQLSVTMSAGLAPRPESTMPIREHALSESYAAADRALYRAKTAGRARLCVEARPHAA